CVAVLEITSSCNLTCPMCYASSRPGGSHMSLSNCQRAIDHLVRYEGRPEVLQLSGGEPTVHPEFLEILNYACNQPIDIVMINTNGIRLASDERLLDELAKRNRRCEVYLQFDGFDDQAYQHLRGESLLETKLKAIEKLGERDVRVTLVCTVERDVNLNQLGEMTHFGIARPWITGISFQPATYVGRYVKPESLEQRVTFPDIISAVADQTGGQWQQSDFLPLPCAHPNAHSLAYGYREKQQLVPLTRFIDIHNHLDLLANGITFNRSSAKELIAEFISRQSCGCSDGQCGPVSLTAFPQSQKPSLPVLGGSIESDSISNIEEMAASFFRRSLAQDLSPADVFRITTTSFMDAYNFDVRQLMKSCVHHLLPSGHLIPFCAYNVLYRTGIVPLPDLNQSTVAGDKTAELVSLRGSV
ncbi:MAG: radical SAM protein, partial [Pirellulales bacterium]